MRLETTALAVVVLMLFAAPVWAEWQLKPFAALTFGGNTSIIDPAQSVGKVSSAVGLSAGLVGEIFGVEGDFGYHPGFFETDDSLLVLNSRMLTLTGNVTVSLPRKMTQYTLRPYAVGGFGLVRASRGQTSFGVLPYERTLPAFDVGGGAVGYISNRFGLNWDVRYFRTFKGRNEGLSIGPEQLSFWRASMALAIRY
jgi:hypothetical protein